MNAESITFRLNIPLKIIEPVPIKVEIEELLTGKTFTWVNERYQLVEDLVITLGNLTHTELYKVKLFIDGQIMFCGSYDGMDLDLPF